MSIFVTACRSLVLTLIASIITSCIHPSNAKIEFTNHSKKDIKEIHIEGLGINFRSTTLRKDESYTWNEDLADSGGIKITITFVDGTTISHIERYFTNHREIKAEITISDINVTTISDGYL